MVGDNTVTASSLREAFRNLQAWRSAQEAEVPDDVYGSLDELGDGMTSMSLWDVGHYYDCSQYYLPRRQADAVRLRLYEDLSPEQSCEALGLSPSTPVDAYVTAGLKTLAELIANDRLPGPGELSGERLQYPQVRRGRLAELKKGRGQRRRER